MNIKYVMFLAYIVYDALRHKKSEELKELFEKQY
jgi:hypothetical protein